LSQKDFGQSNKPFKPELLLYRFENKGGMLRSATKNKDSSGAEVNSLEMNK